MILNNVDNEKKIMLNIRKFINTSEEKNNYSSLILMIYLYK